MGFAGEPTATFHGGMSLVTSEPAPTTAPSLIVTPGRTMHPAPIKASFYYDRFFEKRVVVFSRNHWPNPFTTINCISSRKNQWPCGDAYIITNFYGPHSLYQAVLSNMHSSPYLYALPSQNYNILINKRVVSDGNICRFCYYNSLINYTVNT